MSGLKGVYILISQNGRNEWLKVISCFNPYFLILSYFLKMPKKAKSKSINIANKWKKCYIKTDSKLWICWLSTFQGGEPKIIW